MSADRIRLSADALIVFTAFLHRTEKGRNRKFLTFGFSSYLCSMELQEQLRQIKRALHSMMNGPVSQAMRNKGLTYKVNFGVEKPRLEEFSHELPKTYELAAALWKENIRECRLLASMLMPVADFPADLADVWVEQILFPEEADNLVFYLLSRTSYASERAFVWLADERPMFRYVGYQLLGRLFTEKKVPNRRDMLEYLDHTTTDLRADNTMVKQAAWRSLMKFMDLGIGQERLGNQVLESVGM